MSQTEWNDSEGEAYRELQDCKMERRSLMERVKQLEKESEKGRMDQRIAQLESDLAGAKERAEKGDAAMNENCKLRQEIERLSGECSAQLTELDAISAALGTRDGHSSVTHIQRLREALRRLEWCETTVIGPASMSFFCPICQRHKTSGHETNCGLAALLEGSK